MLEDPLGWPSWWRGVKRVDQLESGDERRVGSRYLIEWRSRVPYPIEFAFTVERLERAELMEGCAEGDLNGRGCWRLFEERGITAVIYDWRVSTSKRWMNAIAPLARGVFQRNHDTVMRWGGEGLAQRLGARLLASG